MRWPPATATAAFLVTKKFIFITSMAASDNQNGELENLSPDEIRVLKSRCLAYERTIAELRQQTSPRRVKVVHDDRMGVGDPAFAQRYHYQRQDLQRVQENVERLEKKLQYARENNKDAHRLHKSLAQARRLQEYSQECVNNFEAMFSEEKLKTFRVYIEKLSETKKKKKKSDDEVEESEGSSDAKTQKTE